jgi:hypothetical protein
MESAGSQRVKPFLCFFFDLMETAIAIPGGARSNTEGFLCVVNGEV